MGSRLRAVPGLVRDRVLHPAKVRVADDLRSDPYLPYILLLATLLAAFWFWHRIPNFATRDEKSRLLDAMVPIGQVVADPSLESLRTGITWSRVPFGATLYLFGLAVLPVVLVAALTGELAAFADIGLPDEEFGYYPVWRDTPEWIWTLSLAIVRLFNVAFAVGAVYLTYRLGTATRDRATGRFAAIVLALTWGLLTIAHEGGEDVPALFFLLLSLYLVVRYVQTGDRSHFFAASVAGGVAIAFKLTAAPIVGLIGVGFVLRARREGATLSGALWQPRLLAGGAALGAVTIVLGFPTLLVGGVEPFYNRVFGGPVARATHETGPDAPVWWWFLRGYFSSFGLPLFVAAVGGVLGSAVTIRERTTDADAMGLVLTALGAYLLLFSLWHDFRPHHLLPTFPLVAVLVGAGIVTTRRRFPSIARPAIALLLVTTGIYAGVGVAGYAAMPRDQADAWIAENVGDDETVEVYRRDFQDAAVPHGVRVNHLFGWEGPDEVVDPCPAYVQLGYRDLLYLKNGSYYRGEPEKATYVRALLDGEFNYTIAAEFGTRSPDFVPERPTTGSVVDLLGHGVVPQTDQYADEQELAANQYTVILERTGECRDDRDPPF